MSCNVRTATEIAALVRAGDAAGCIDGMAMGAGKTLDTLLLLETMLEERRISPERRALVVVPPKTMAQWLEELAEWTPQLRVVQPQREAVRLLQLEANAADVAAAVEAGDAPMAAKAAAEKAWRQGQASSADRAAAASVVLVSYSVFEDPDYFDVFLSAKGRFALAVFDEVRGFEVEGGRVRRHVDKLRNNDTFILGLTGTPISYNARGVRALLSTVGADVGEGWSGLRSAARKHIVRHPVAPRWPVRMRLAEVRLTAAQQAAYDTVVDLTPPSQLRRSQPDLEGIVRCDVNGLSEEPTLDELIDHSAKVGCLVHWLGRLDSDAASKETTARAVIWTQGDASATLVTEVVARVCGYEPEEIGRIDGNTPADRTHACQMWFNDPSPGLKIIVATHNAGGRGLNLPATTEMLFFDVVRSHRIMDQCVHRALRLPREVGLALRVIFCVAVDTIDQGRWHAVQVRGALSAAYEAGNAPSGCDSALRHLLSGDGNGAETARVLSRLTAYHASGRSRRDRGAEWPWRSLRPSECQLSVVVDGEADFARKALATALRALERSEHAPDLAAAEERRKGDRARAKVVPDCACAANTEATTRSGGTFRPRGGRWSGALRARLAAACKAQPRLLQELIDLTVFQGAPIDRGGDAQGAAAAARFRPQPPQPPQPPGAAAAAASPAAAGVGALRTAAGHERARAPSSFQAPEVGEWIEVNVKHEGEPAPRWTRAQSLGVVDDELGEFACRILGRDPRSVAKTRLAAVQACATGDVFYDILSWKDADQDWRQTEAREVTDIVGEDVEDEAEVIEDEGCAGSDDDLIDASFDENEVDWVAVAEDDLEVETELLSQDNWANAQEHKRRRKGKKSSAPKPEPRGHLYADDYETMGQVDPGAGGRRKASSKLYDGLLATKHKQLKKVLKLTWNGVGSGDDRVFNPPIGISLPAAARRSIQDGFATVPGAAVVSVESSLGDNFQATLLRLAPRSQAANRVLAAMFSVAGHLRPLCFELELARLLEDSRGARMVFTGWEANRARATALLSQAFGLRSDNYLGGTEYAPMHMPTIIHRTYVEGGEIPLGEALMTLTLFKRKHRGKLVQSGPHAGTCNADALLAPLERALQLSAQAFSREMAAHAPDATEGFLELVAPAARYSPETWLTTFAFYTNGAMMGEASEHLKAARLAHTRAKAALEAAVAAATSGSTRRAKPPQAAPSQGSPARAGAAMDAVLSECEEAASREKRELPRPAQSLLDGARREQRRYPTDFGGAFNEAVLHQARVRDNRLVQEKRAPLSKEKESYKLKNEGEGSLELTAAAFASLVESTCLEGALTRIAPTPAVWCTNDVETQCSFAGGVTMQMGTYTCLMKGGFAARVVAGLCATYAQLGHEGVRSEMARTRCEDEINAYTTDVHQEIVQYYRDYEADISGAFMPGRFVDDSRTTSVLDTAVKHQAGWREQYGAGEGLVRMLLVACAAMFTSKPEVGKHFLSHGLHLAEAAADVDGDPGALVALCAFVRDQWASAPGNGGIEENGRPPAGWPIRCSCKPESGCLGKPENKPRRDGQAAKTPGCRRQQPVSWHDSKDEDCDCMNEGRELLEGLLALDAKKLQDALESGEIAVKDIIEPVKHMGPVRSNTLSRLVFLAYHTAKSARPDELGHFVLKLPGSQAQMPRLTPHSMQKVLAFCDRYGCKLTPTEKQSGSEAAIRFSSNHGEAVLVGWWQALMKERPGLRVLNRVVMRDMRLLSRWDVQREEEPHCEVPKGVAGAAVTDQLPGARHLRGVWPSQWPASVTGFEKEAPRLTARTTTYVDADGQLWLERTSFAPGLVSEACEVSTPAAVAEGGSSALEDARLAALRAAVARAKRDETHALELEKKARGRKDAAKSAVEEQKATIDSLAGRGSSASTSALGGANASFLDLVRHCNGCEKRALNIWAACEFEGVVVDTHLDNDDLPTALNLACAFGLNREGQVVDLVGGMLMVVLAWSETSLARVNLSNGGHAHDVCGNVVILEPSTWDVNLPSRKADSPRTPEEAANMLRQGKGVVAFFPACGGVVAAQLGHFWHGVTQMDPNDVYNELIRVALIGYPNMQVAVSAKVVHEQWSSCTFVKSHELAQTLVDQGVVSAPSPVGIDA